MKLIPIFAEDFKLDGGACFGVVPKSIWSKYYTADENNMLPIALRCLLVDTGERVILIDNGIGDKQDGKFREHLYLFGNRSLKTSFAEAGYSYDDVTDVLLTHLHYDHCGGGVQYNEDRTGFELTFKKAAYWCSRAQWEWALKPNPREGASYLKENLLPMHESGKLNFIEQEGLLTAEIFLKIYNGHTEGQIIPVIAYKNRKVVFMSDFIPTPANVPLPYVASYDTRPLLSMEEKKRFLDEAVNENYILFFEHDYLNEACSLEQTIKGVRMKNTGTVEQLIQSS